MWNDGISVPWSSASSERGRSKTWRTCKGLSCRLLCPWCLKTPLPASTRRTTTSTHYLRKNEEAQHSTPMTKDTAPVLAFAFATCTLRNTPCVCCLAFSTIADRDRRRASAFSFLLSQRHHLPADFNYAPLCVPRRPSMSTRRYWARSCAFPLTFFLLALARGSWPWRVSFDLMRRGLELEARPQFFWVGVGRVNVPSCKCQSFQRQVLFLIVPALCASCCFLLVLALGLGDNPPLCLLR